LKKNKINKYIFLAIISCILTFKLEARVIEVGKTKSFTNLKQAIKKAKSGDTIVVDGGVYFGNFKITKSLSLIGKNNPILDAKNSGHTVELLAPNIIIKNFSIINSGTSLVNSDSCIKTAKKAKHLLIENNTLKDCLWGIWVEASFGAKVINNRVFGLKELMSQKRGNGIHFWNVKQAHIEGNLVDGSRDGIYIFATSESKILNNTVRDLRYGIHYMHSDNNRVERNEIVDSRMGLALMFSRELEIIGNVSKNNSDKGILMRDLMDSRIHENKIDGSEVGLFFYNSLYNHVTKNYISNNGIGAHVWAGSFENTVFDNMFVNNKFQTKYVAATDEQWSLNKKGNYWTNYLGWDLDKNGVGDVPFIGNGIVERLVWTYPVLRVLLNSPAVQTLRMSESQFPIIRSPSIIDDYPLMTPPKGMENFKI
jgi:nitrous oxidase accessory protein